MSLFKQVNHVNPCSFKVLSYRKIIVKFIEKRNMKITQSTIIKYIAVILCLGVTIKLAMGQEAAVRKDVSQFRQRLLQITTSSPRTIQPRIAGAYSIGVINGKKIKKQAGISVKVIRDRMDKGTKVVSGIVSSFAGPGDASTLEDAFSKYDELMEDIEADLTKTKIGLGLKLEESLKNYKKSTDQFFRQLRSFQGGDWGYWTNQGNYFQLNEKEMKKKVLRLNDLLSQGFVSFLDMSEKGKDVLRRLYKRRYQMRNNSS